MTLTVVAVLVSGTVGVVVGSVTDADAGSATYGDYRFDANASGVSVTHAGGDAVPLSALSLVLRGPNGSASVTFVDGTLADGGTAFEPGSTWRYAAAPFPFDGPAELDLLVVHRPSETVVDDATVGVGPPASSSPPPPVSTTGPTSTRSPEPTATPSPEPTATPTATPTQSPTPAPPAAPPADEDWWDGGWWDDWWGGDDGDGGDDDTGGTDGGDWWRW